MYSRLLEQIVSDPQNDVMWRLGILRSARPGAAGPRLHSYVPWALRSPYSRQHAESEAQAAQKSISRVDRIISRLPHFLQRYAEPLRRAPLTHITSFLLLHELTAIIPLFTLAGTFHYTQWLPPYISEGRWVSDATQKFGNYFRRKGWLGEEDRARYRWWGRGEGGVRIVVEFATAYAITKALLPLRLMLSVWGTPWFARKLIVPSMNLAKRVFRRQKSPSARSGAAGTGAVGGGSVPTSASSKVGDRGGAGGGEPFKQSNRE